MSEEHIDIQDPYDETQGELRARAMRESLDQFDLDEEDRALLNEEFDYGDEVEDEFGLPVLAVIGRPNVVSRHWSIVLLEGARPSSKILPE